MPITGGVKFFKRNKGLKSDGATGTASPSGDSSAEFIIDRNRITHYRSVGSDDTTTETIDIALTGSNTIDRLLLVDHNLKDFDITYDSDGVGTFLNFTSVIGLDGSVGGGIIETAFADDTAYYEFDSVAVFGIRIIANTTQVVDAEKFINQLIITEEVGTLNGFPDLQPTINNNERDRIMLSGRHSVTKSDQFFGVVMGFDPYPAQSSDFQSDLLVAQNVFARLESTLVWLSGGKRNTGVVDPFSFTLKTFRLRDIFNMQTIGEKSASFFNNIYLGPVQFSMQFIESVD